MLYIHNRKILSRVYFSSCSHKNIVYKYDNICDHLFGCVIDAVFILRRMQEEYHAKVKKLCVLWT